MISVLAGVLPAHAQGDSAQATPPPQVQELLRLLEDPSVRGWIDRQRQSQMAASEAAPQKTTAEMLAMRVAATREHFVTLAAAVPRLPQEVRRAFDLLSQELRSRPFLDVIALVLGFLALGTGTEWIFNRATAPTRERILSSPGNTVSQRVRLIAKRFAVGLAHVAIFGIGSIGAFLLFDWPPLLRHIVLAYLFAALLFRLALLVGRTLLAPLPAGRQDAETYRIVPVMTDAARFWYRRLALFVGWFIFGWATVNLVHILGFSPGGRRLVAYTLGIGLLVIAIETVWRSPRSSSEREILPESRARHRTAGPWLMSVYLVLLWGLWIAGLMGLFWLAVVAVVLPQSIALARRSSHHVLRPDDMEQAAPDHDLYAVYLDRGLRALLIAGAALFLAQVWQIDLVELTSRDTLLTRLIRGVLSSIVILLVADLIWQVVKTQIDRRLSRSQVAAPPGSEEALRQARLRTLLPIFRNVAFVVLAVVAVLMALSALGVEIGPLIAGAGIVGVAVGFGSQTLVKDVISGIFYLLDDAFRVGEYIQSGSYKGTVESLGFRSVKLRHHRGYVYTVPFGQLGAVENMSRDWVIDKMTVNVTYDTDLDKAKKIIKQIGKELAQDPDFAHNILEPLKMQGVEQFGDFAMQLRMKIMTRPGEQFVIRRRAYAMLKKAFDENGIRFAFPTVQVSGREEAEPAAARQVLTLIKGNPSEEGGQSP
jgi:small-conductance mechanosensitive channel